MGIFDFLFGSGTSSTVQEVDDLVWMSQAAKLNGLRKELQQRNDADSVGILLVAHFPQTLQHLQQMAAELGQEKQVTPILASDLQALVGNSLNVDETKTIDMIVAERHPLLSENEALKAAAEQLPCRCRLVHHLSLEDVVLKQFVGEWVINMLKKLGMTEDESIQSAMVGKRIKQAQKKFQNQPQGDQPAQSAEEWMQLNMPQTK